MKMVLIMWRNVKFCHDLPGCRYFYVLRVSSLPLYILYKTCCLRICHGCWAHLIEPSGISFGSGGCALHVHFVLRT